MADTRRQHAEEIYAYASQVAEDDRDVEDHGEKYARQLGDTVARLKERLEQERSKLRETEASMDESLRIGLEPAGDPAELLRQRRVITAAYRRLTNSRPALPERESVLPGLIALRAAGDASTETRELLPRAQAEVVEARRRLDAEEKRLAALRLLDGTLRERIAELVGERDRQSRLSAEEIAEERLQKLRAKEEAYHDEANELGSELKWFIKEHLAPMLAAEQRGGPPVGDLPAVTDEMLGAGFTESGKPKQLKAADGSGGREELAKAGRQVRRQVYDDTRRLMQDLLNAATGDGEDEPGWIEAPENSRAVQYLVTAQVAMFHPDDARKVRLLDFAG